MVEQFNRILAAFGSNRVRLVHVKDTSMRFAISGWAEFIVFVDGELHESSKDRLFTTGRSIWLQALSLGKTRNDLGSIEE
jgi:hypothetical protein